jgi:hypothetical protein
VTTVGYGPDPLNRYITTYFRRWIYVPPDATYTNFNFRLKRDDGGVVYLNGREMFRSNMPAGIIITNLTLASSAVVIPDEETFFPTSMLATNLVVGSNIVAVEIHQNAPGSGDLGFDLEFIGVGFAASAPAPAITIARISSDLKISWPVRALPWNLYSSPSVSPGVWTRVGTTASAVNGFNVLTVTPGSQSTFYQLHRP